MKIFTYIRSHVVLSAGIAIVAVITSVIAGRVATRSKTVTENTGNDKKVVLVDVSSFRNDISKVSADGIVESVSQVDLRSQISAPLASVNLGIGDNVLKGQIIATLQNADIRAQLDQAKAGLRLVQGQYTSTGDLLEAPRKSALETLQSSYLIADEVINIDLNPFLYDQTGGNQRLSSFITDRNLDESIRARYLKAKDMSTFWKKSIDSLTTSSSNSEIASVISSSQENLKNISLLLEDISKVINDAIKGTPVSSTYTTLTGWQNTVSLGRNNINGAIKTLTSAGSGLSGSEAQISSAQAIVKNLEAQLAKTIITSPISGKIASLPLRVGELAQPGQLIATVVGGGGLQIKAYASGEDLSKIAVGANVMVESNIKGKVVSVAPSVNAVNRKVETKISIDNGEQSGLIVGQNVNVLIEAEKTTATAAESNVYLIPIQNVKIIPGFAYVFTVNDESKIVKNSVTIGKIQGDFIEIISGIRPDMKIVSPVYELEEGQKVIVQ